MTAIAEATIEVRVRVADGAAFLDTEHPGWWRTIDLGRLHMEDPCHCILGQIWGSYYQAPITVDTAARLGFDVSDDAHAAGEGPAMREFAVLAEAWRELIERRRAEAGAA